MEREALKLALEALKEIARHATTPYEDAWCGELADETLTAINALAQPAQKPKSFTYNEVADAMNSLRKGNSVQKAYAEEVGKLKLYAAPQQRPWVGLEGEEIRNLWEEAAKPDRSTMAIVTSFARAIEAKLKEKNNG